MAISNSSLENTIQSVEISGDELIGGSAVNFDLTNTIRNTSASGATFRFRVYVQGVIVYDDTSSNLSSAVGLIAQQLSVKCLIDPASWSVLTFGSFMNGGRGAATVGVAGDLGTAIALPSAAFIGSPTAYRVGDALTIRVTVQMSLANANLEFTNVYNQLQIITG